MIFGDCPYCGEPIETPCAAKTPAFSKETCPSCGNQYWQRHSRIDPEAYTLDEFAERYAIDEQTKTISEKNPPKPLTPEERVIADMLIDRMTEALLYGTGSQNPDGFITHVDADFLGEEEV